jgi:phosphatidylserine/phosphatidylglycerophosphate/cardiolipin synthase-like enzyme
LDQAILDFLAQAKDSTYTLHAAIYEFQKDTLLTGLKQALARGADVQVVYHHRQPPVKASAADAGADDDSAKGTAAENDAQIAALGLDMKRKDGSPVCLPRSASPQGAIMHNKFVVLLQNGIPQAVSTGSTNWTDGGLYGQLNLGYGIYDAGVAAKYEAFWQGLSKDPSAADSRLNAGKLSQVTSSDPGSIPPGFTAVFSPQDSKSKMLELYGEVAKAAPFLLVCAPFELADQILEPMKLPHAGRGYYLLLDKEGSLGHDPKAPKDAAGDPKATRKTAANFSTIQGNPGTLVSVAAPLAGPLYNYQHAILEHPESFHHVGIHIHAKIIASDPLGPDPILIIGSANYSNGSTHINDENSVIVRGSPGLMDICLSEFMRVFDTYLFRYEHKNDQKGFAVELEEDERWTAEYYQPGSAKAIGRAYFAGTEPG